MDWFEWLIVVFTTVPGAIVAWRIVAKGTAYEMPPPPESLFESYQWVF